MKRKFKYDKYKRNKYLFTTKEFLSLHSITTTAINPNNIPNNPPIFNITGKPISSLVPNDILNIIRQGLKHIPQQTSATLPEINRAIEDTIARTSWKIIYSEDDSEYDSSFTTNKRPTPCVRLSKNPAILQLKSRLTEAAAPLLLHKIPDSSHNISKIRIENPDLIFKPADKNLGITLMNLTQYHQLVMDHLENQNIYDKVRNAVDFKGSPKYRGIESSFNSLRFPVADLVKNHPLFIQKFVKKIFAATATYDIPPFHVIPKLHKPGKLSSRPIVGATNWFTTPISKLLDYLIKPEIDKIHILKDTKNLVNQLGQIITTNEEILVSMDVTALYTNIDIKILGDLIKKNFNITIYKMLNFIFKNNYFEYADDIYRQKDGIAMGTNAAPTLANLYLDKLIDCKMIENEKIKNYYRYIDDIFFTWSGSTTELTEFTSYINNLIPNLKFTYKSDEHRIEFLDLNIIINHETNKLDYYTFQKPLNKYSYITTYSCHPESTIKGFIKGELIRYKRNSSNSFYFNHTKNLFKQRLMERGYRRNYISPIFDQITYTSSPEPRSDKIKIPFILPFTKHPMAKQVRINIKNLENDISKILPGSRIITAYSKRKNIGQLLTRSRLSKEQIQIIKKTNKNFYNQNKIQNVSTPKLKFPATAEFLSRNTSIPKRIPKQQALNPKSAIAYFNNPNRVIPRESLNETRPIKKKPKKVKPTEEIKKGQTRITDFFNKNQSF